MLEKMDFQKSTKQLIPMSFRHWPVFLISFLLLSVSVDAQKGYELGGWLGVSNYFGDLNNRVDITHPGLAGGINVRYNFNNRTSVKGSLNFGRIHADDADSPNNFERNRNLSFRSNVIDLTGVFEFNFFPYNHGSATDYYTPYLLGGLSIFRFKPQAELDGTWYDLPKMGTEGQELGDEYNTVSGGLVVGAGWKWDINYEWSINIELSYRRVMTDYLDDVSGVYADKSIIRTLRGETAVLLSDRSLEDGLGEAGRQRGNSKDNDAYTFFGVSIMKYFGRLECPKISKI